MKRYLVAAVVCLLLPTGCQDSSAKDKKKPSAGPPTANVSVASIAATSMRESRKFLGEIDSASSTVLAAGGAGTVLKIAVREGDRVKKGKVLVQLDDAVLRAQLSEVIAELDRRKVELAQATRDAARLGALSKQGHVPSSEAEQVSSREGALQASVAGQQASVQRLREEIEQMRIRAPFEGVISARMVAPGQWLRVGEPAVEIASESGLEAHVRVPSEVLALVDEKTRATISDDNGKTVEGSIAGVVGSLDRRTRTALLRVVPTEQPAWLREGDAMDVVLELNRNEQEGVVVPTDAIVYGVAGARVFRVVDGKAEPHSVEVLVQSLDRALISAPMLKMGDNVVVRGNERLRPGQPVEVMP